MRKNKVLLICIAIVSLTIIAIASVYIFSKRSSKMSDGENKKSESLNASSTPINNYIINTNNNDYEDFKTKYADGRISDVRKFRYYDSLVKKFVPTSGMVTSNELGLIVVITEWDNYDANVATAQEAFIQVERTSQDIATIRAELKASGADPNIDLSSTMVGGDTGSNSRMKEPAKKYWAVASKMFEQEFKNLKKAEGISNRDVDSVTFDFITTSGFYTVQVQKADLESGKSVWSNMFKESKFLNTEMARVQNESAIDEQKKAEARQLKK